MPKLTVKRLKKLLENQPDDFLVILSSDAEGNGYAPGYSYATGQWKPRDREFIHHEEDAEYRTGPDNAICFWPE